MIYRLTLPKFLKILHISKEVQHAERVPGEGSINEDVQERKLHQLIPENCV